MASIRKQIRRTAAGMGRRRFITLLGGAVAWPPAARAQQPTRMRRIGVLLAMAADDPETQLRIKAFEAGLRDLGWVAGRNLRLDYRWAGNDEAVMRSAAAELTGLAPDLIVAHSTPVMAAMREQRRAVPVVFVQVTDPVGQGLVPSLARPGGHFTGFTTFEFSIGTKWLETLKVVAPRVAQVALVFNPETAPYAHLFRQPVEAAAAGFDVTLVPGSGRDAAAIERAVNELARTPNGGLMVLPDVSTVKHRDLIIALAARHRLPAIYPFRFYATSGGLLSYGADLADVFRRTAGYVDRILKGARAGDLPVQSPSKYELVINLKTANALGITMPPLLLARTDEVIE
jgi:putative ABC transport system substrate-binding protein